jgi:hypothetical protein
MWILFLADDKSPQISLTLFLMKKDRVRVDLFLPNNESLNKFTISK